MLPMSTDRNNQYYQDTINIPNKNWIQSQPKSWQVSLCVFTSKLSPKLSSKLIRKRSRIANLILRRETWISRLLGCTNQDWETREGGRTELPKHAGAKATMPQRFFPTNGAGVITIRNPGIQWLRTWVQFPAQTWQLPTICTSNLWGYNIPLLVPPTKANTLAHWHRYKQNTQKRRERRGEARGKKET